jgi:hypothetical protein
VGYASFFFFEGNGREDPGKGTSAQVYKRQSTRLSKPKNKKEQKLQATLSPHK